MILTLVSPTTVALLFMDGAVSATFMIISDAVTQSFELFIARRRIRRRVRQIIVNRDIILEDDLPHEFKCPLRLGGSARAAAHIVITATALKSCIRCGQTRYSPARTLRLGAILFGGGVLMSISFRLLHLISPVTTVSSVVWKTALTQVVGWVSNATMLIVNAAYDPALTVRGKLRTDLAPLLLANTLFWTNIHLVQFAYVPLGYQILFTRGCAIVWDCALSHFVAGRPSPRETACGVPVCCGGYLVDRGYVPPSRYLHPTLPPSSRLSHQYTHVHDGIPLYTTGADFMDPSTSGNGRRWSGANDASVMATKITQRDVLRLPPPLVAVSPHEHARAEGAAPQGRVDAELRHGKKSPQRTTWLSGWHAVRRMLVCGEAGIDAGGSVSDDSDHGSEDMQCGGGPDGGGTYHPQRCRGGGHGSGGKDDDGGRGSVGAHGGRNAGAVLGCRDGGWRGDNIRSTANVAAAIPPFALGAHTAFPGPAPGPLAATPPSGRSPPHDGDVDALDTPVGGTCVMSDIYTSSVEYEKCPLYEGGKGYIHPGVHEYVVGDTYVSMDGRVHAKLTAWGGRRRARAADASPCGGRGGAAPPRARMAAAEPVCAGVHMPRCSLM